MIRWRRCIVLAALLGWSGASAATVFSGEVEAIGSQRIDTPPSMSSPVVLRYYMADGATVQRGDTLLRIDAGPAEAEVQKLQAQAVQTAAKNAKEVAELELKQMDAELALADAQAERDTAAVDAATPRGLLSALDYDRYRSEMKRTDRALALKRDEAREAAAAVTRRRQDGELQLRKQQLSLGFYQDQVKQAVVYAARDGTLVHGFDNMFGAGGRYEEGSSSYPGQQVGEVVSLGQGFRARAWVLEPDRAALHVGQRVWLAFDALPGRTQEGRIHSIAGAPAARSEWGDGRYFEIGIDLPGAAGMPLQPGMSVRVDTKPGDTPSATLARVDQAPLDVEGELYAQRSIAISPPAVDGLWQLTVTQIAGDGQSLKKGDMLVVFDSGEVTKKLVAKRGELAEKLRKQEQLRLDLADRAREAELATAQARAEMGKAQRKASQPKEIVPGVKYRKLVIARIKATRRLALTLQRQKIAVDEREAEQRMADADARQAKLEVDGLQASLGALTVTAPRDGIVIHHSGWNGNKIDVGSQVWRGQSVAEMPDLSSLAVRASLPERELTRVFRGQRVRVVIAGGGERKIGGHIAQIGGTVHSKSRVEPVPVVDLIVQLDDNRLQLRPGQSVRVEISAGKENKP